MKLAMLSRNELVKSQKIWWEWQSNDRTERYLEVRLKNSWDLATDVENKIER